MEKVLLFCDFEALLSLLSKRAISWRHEMRSSCLRNTQILIILCASLCGLVMPSYAWSADKNPVLVLNDVNKPPYTTEKGDGFIDLLVSDMFHRVGLSLKLVKVSPERGLINANEGLVDGDVNRIKGLDKLYQNLVMVPETLRDSYFCALSFNPDIHTSRGDLDHHEVGYIKGWKIYEKMMAGSNKATTADSPEQLFRLLKLNRIEVALYACVEGLALAEQMKLKRLYVLQPHLSKVPLYLYLNKKYADLVPRLDRALKNIKKDGTYDQLYRNKILPYLNM